MLNHKLFGAQSFGINPRITTFGSSGTTNDEARSVQFSGSHFVGSLSVAGSPNTAEIVKFDVSGSTIWNRKLSLSTFLNAYCHVEVHTSNDVYVLLLGRNSGSNNWVVLVKYNSSGAIQWQRKISDSANIANHHLALDASGNPIVGATRTSTPSSAEIIKYNGSGSVQWRRRLSVSSGICSISGIKCDSSNNIFVGVTSGSSPSFRGNIVKYNSSGVLQWQTQYFLGSTSGSMIAIDSSGNIYTAGYVSSGSQIACVAKHNSSGSATSAITLSGSNQPASSIFADNSGNIYLAYAYPSGALLKLNSSLSILWQKSIYGTAGGSTAGRAYNAKSNGDGLLLYAGSATQTSTGYEAVFGTFTDDGAGSGTYGWMTYGDISWATTSVTLTNTSGTFTDAAGGLSDSAGDATDAAGTVTSATYTRT